MFLISCRMFMLVHPPLCHVSYFTRQSVFRIYQNPPTTATTTAAAFTLYLIFSFQSDQLLSISQHHLPLY